MNIAYGRSYNIGWEGLGESGLRMITVMANYTTREMPMIYP